MKINEKNLYTFANSKPVDKEGERWKLFSSLGGISSLSISSRFSAIQAWNEISKAVVCSERESLVLLR